MKKKYTLSIILLFISLSTNTAIFARKAGAGSRAGLPNLNTLLNIDNPDKTSSSLDNIYPVVEKITDFYLNTDDTNTRRKLIDAFKIYAQNQSFNSNDSYSIGEQVAKFINKANEKAHNAKPIKKLSPKKKDNTIFIEAMFYEIAKPIIEYKFNEWKKKHPNIAAHAVKNYHKTLESNTITTVQEVLDLNIILNIDRTDNDEISLDDNVISNITTQYLETTDPKKQHLLIEAFETYAQQQSLGDNLVSIDLENDSGYEIGRSVAIFFQEVQEHNNQAKGITKLGNNRSDNEKFIKAMFYSLSEPIIAQQFKDWKKNNSDRPAVVDAIEAYLKEMEPKMETKSYFIEMIKNNGYTHRQEIEKSNIEHAIEEFNAAIHVNSSNKMYTKITLYEDDNYRILKEYKKNLIPDDFLQHYRIEMSLGSNLSKENIGEKMLEDALEEYHAAVEANKDNKKKYTKVTLYEINNKHKKEIISWSIDNIKEIKTWPGSTSN